MFKLPISFVKSVNEMIKRNSNDTAVCFLNMPVPPSSNELEKHENYLNQLRRLTDDLPPTLLVYGLSSVISTAL